MGKYADLPYKVGEEVLLLPKRRVAVVVGLLPDGCYVRPETWEKGSGLYVTWDWLEPMPPEGAPVAVKFGRRFYGRTKA